MPLRAGGELLGVIVVGERVRWRPLAWEDRELLQVLADQSASVLRDARMSRRLKEASEMAAFQNMSAFFLHDLKNLANRLSLTVQNLPRHYEKREFREEAFRTIGLSVDKIKEMCSKLSLLKEKIELEPVETRLSDFVRTVVGDLQPQFSPALVFEPAASGAVLLDPKQFRKVVVNLVLNAWEAASPDFPKEQGAGSKERERGNSEFRIQNSEFGRRGEPGDGSRGFAAGFGFRVSGEAGDGEREFRIQNSRIGRSGEPGNGNRETGGSTWLDSELGTRNSEPRNSEPGTPAKPEPRNWARGASPGLSCGPGGRGVGRCWRWRTTAAG